MRNRVKGREISPKPFESMVYPDNHRVDYGKVNTLASGQSLSTQMKLLSIGYK